jgi:polysaccharide export outer membrane protein
MKRVLSLIFISAILLTGFSFAQESKESELSYTESAYRINANDLLEITVFGEESLNTRSRLDTDGTIVFPLLGRVSAVGLTKKELESKITELLAKDYLVNPQVSILILEFARLTVTGQVVKPGPYELKPGLTVMQAIALAGGLTSKADSKNIKLIRTEEKEKATFEINIEDILSGTAKDVTLKPADLIFVGGGLEAGGEIVVVIGQVRTPGRYPYKKKMTVVEAIAMAGGFTGIAAPDGTKVIRQVNEKKKVFRVPVNAILQGRQGAKDITLEPNDTISVPESFF